MASGWYSNRTSHITVGVVITTEEEGSLPFTADYMSKDESWMHGMSRGTHYLGTLYLRLMYCRTRSRYLGWYYISVVPRLYTCVSGFENMRFARNIFS
jgi:hypothetical protein